MDLLPIMITTFPYMSKPLECMNFYYGQCFLVLQYHSTIRNDVIRFVIERSLEFDINIKIQDSGTVILDPDEETEKELVEPSQQEESQDTIGIFEMDGIEEDSKDNIKKNKERQDVNELSDKVRIKLEEAATRRKVLVSLFVWQGPLYSHLFVVLMLASNKKSLIVSFFSCFGTFILMARTSTMPGYCIVKYYPYLKLPS